MGVVPLRKWYEYVAPFDNALEHRLIRGRRLSSPDHPGAPFAARHAVFPLNRRNLAASVLLAQKEPDAPGSQ